MVKRSWRLRAIPFSFPIENCKVMRANAPRPETFLLLCSVLPETSKVRDGGGPSSLFRPRPTHAPPARPPPDCNFYITISQPQSRGTESALWLAAFLCVYVRRARAHCRLLHFFGNHRRSQFSTLLTQFARERL